MLKRRVLFVEWRRSCWLTGGGWAVYERNSTVELGCYTTKAKAIRAAVRLARSIAPSQLRIKNKNGRIAKGGHGERTYGKDPRRTRG